jgi:hypothetical protein
VNLLAKDYRLLICKTVEITILITGETWSMKVGQVSSLHTGFD